jgi:hypothetical protein
MPTISEFYGIKIVMRYREKHSPHLRSVCRIHRVDRHRGRLNPEWSRAGARLSLGSGMAGVAPRGTLG